MSEMMSSELSEVDEAIDDVIDEVIVVLSDELKEMLIKKRMIWVRDWIARRDEYGASQTVIREIAVEDPLEFKKQLRMTVEKFEELLQLCLPLISKRNTTMRNCIPARTKLEATLLYLATGVNFSSLCLLFRLPISTISCFLPEVLQAIITVLSEYILVSGIFRYYNLINM